MVTLTLTDWSVKNKQFLQFISFKLEVFCLNSQCFNVCGSVLTLSVVLNTMENLDLI